MVFLLSVIQFWWTQSKSALLTELATSGATYLGWPGETFFTGALHLLVHYSFSCHGRNHDEQFMAEWVSLCLMFFLVFFFPTWFSHSCTSLRFFSLLSWLWLMSLLVMLTFCQTWYPIFLKPVFYEWCLPFSPHQANYCLPEWQTDPSRLFRNWQTSESKLSLMLAFSVQTCFVWEIDSAVNGSDNDACVVFCSRWQRWGPSPPTQTLWSRAKMCLCCRSSRTEKRTTSGLPSWKSQYPYALCVTLKEHTHNLEALHHMQHICLRLLMLLKCFTFLARLVCFSTSELPAFSR